jgi:hypothetical protein
VRLSEILNRNKAPAEKGRARPRLGLPSTSFGSDLSRFARSFRKEASVEHVQKRWKRVFLSKSRYMGGLQCSKKLWQTVYDPEPAKEPLPGTVKGMGIEVGVKARLLWPFL